MWVIYGKTIQPFLFHFVPANVREIFAFLVHSAMQIVLSAIILVLSPILYIIDQIWTRQIKLPQYKHILITGASSGVGSGLCSAYAKAGVRIVMVSRSAAAMQQVAEHCRSAGADAVVEEMDVADAAGMEQIIQRAEAAAPIDLVISAAGLEASMLKDEDIVNASRPIVTVQLLGQLNTVLPCIPYMRQRKSGQLVFVSSQLGFLAAPLATDYDSAKVAIRLYAEGLRVLLWKDNIAVNVIVPGAMDTPMMNSLADRGKMPIVPLVLSVPSAVGIMQEGLRRNVGEIAFPSIMTAFNASVGSWPAFIRLMFLHITCAEEHRQWRLGLKPQYKDHGDGTGKQDDSYAKWRTQEPERQRKEL